MEGDTNLASILSEQPAPEPTVQPEVEQETLAPQAEQTGEQEEAPPAEPPKEEEDKRQKGLEAALLAERRRRQEIEAKLSEYVKPKEEPKPLTRPARDQYANQEAYEDALLDYGAQKMRLVNEAERVQKEQEKQAEDFAKAADETVSKGRSKYPDFDAVINDGLAPFLNPVLREALIRGGGHEVAYWLGKNPAEAARISQLPPMSMVLEVGRLQAQAVQPERPPVPPRTLTQERNAQGQFKPVFGGPTPLDAIVARK